MIESGNLHRTVRNAIFDIHDKRNSYAIGFSLTFLINDVAAEEQQMKMVAISHRVLKYIKKPTNDMKRIHEIKWIL